ncbi:MAG: hypothetical protein ACNS62_05105 [Candidatus Cyclobacteriaceae bacterium M3_2C_046]
MKRNSIKFLQVYFLCLFSCQPFEQTGEALEPLQISGIYPHLAYYNDEGECGTGAVVPWQDRLWVITYGPHLPLGSSDKLYEITPDLKQIIRQESIGGTPANRMIHQESNQLFIGPYAIDQERNVRVIPYAMAPGRHTGTARHLTNPAEMVYYGTMEEGFYEVGVEDLDVNVLYRDINENEISDAPQWKQTLANLYGAHGKGLYSGQGVLVYSNNGESSAEAREKFDIASGSLSEWDGQDWKLVRRNQFVEVTGPGGIYGNSNPATDPIWATGWDHKSLILAVRDQGQWSFYRLPKASHSYDGAHGWNTEWPRIRDVGTEQHPDYLMTMHGMFWRFPGSFSAGISAGIRPRSAYLKVIGDFARWKNQLVFGCDDSAQREFLNKRNAKGGIEGPGQSNSNLWFTDLGQPDQLGPSTAEGAVWLEEEIQANKPSEPFLWAGWPHRYVWIHNLGDQLVNFIFEADQQGNDEWSEVKNVAVQPQQSAFADFKEIQSEWIRVRTDHPTKATVHFSYTGEENRGIQPAQIFEGLTIVGQNSTTAGLLYGLGSDRRALGVAAVKYDHGEMRETGYYELDSAMNLQFKKDPETEQFIREKFAIPRQVVSVETSSVLVVDDQGRRWRLPLGNLSFTDLTNAAALRIAREVATERDLFSCHGTFYELPAENADGFAKIRPISSHNFRIHDYASYRGMLIMTGIDPQPNENEHIFISDDGQAAVWAGVIDDLWQLGKPVGQGGPWDQAKVNAGIPSDPYLIGFYDRKQMTLSHESGEPVVFNIEVDPTGHGTWMQYQQVTVDPGEMFEHTFPGAFQARWIRFRTDKPTVATAYLIYE